ncbi:MAG TPA: MBL fold metallo-hydrolase [Microlunatus sp.]|nr:MBL fold metallo-hydrolase [Microlunatus sp.]
MELVVVGCSGSASGPDSPASCYLVRAPHEERVFTLVLDLGPGAFGALYRYLDPAQVDAIALSHLHPDHCLDLTGFYVAATYSSTAPWPSIPVYGPPGTAARIAAAYAVPGAQREAGLGIADRFDYRSWRATQQIGPFAVTTIAAVHSVEAYSLRVSGPDGAWLIYTGDTGPNPKLTELARGADLLLAEAGFLDAPDNPPGIHLSGRDAAQIAAAAGVRRLVLTHIPAWNEPERVLAEARAAFKGPIDLAASGLAVTVGGTA